MLSAKPFLTGSRRLAIAPPALLALLYAALAFMGACLLKLPISAHVPVGWSDALFTATSAVTVTGLVVLNTADFSFFGQFVILVLIQLGGLGIMTFAVLLLSMLGLPIGLTQRIFLREEINQTSMADLVRLVGLILRVVILCELLGVVVLSSVFVPEFGWTKGLWSALFHSVSAFNNAGFSLYPSSLSRWETNPATLGCKRHRKPAAMCRRINFREYATRLATYIWAGDLYIHKFGRTRLSIL